MLVNGALAGLNLAIVGSRSKHLTVLAEAEAQHSSLHQHKVDLGREKKVGNTKEGLKKVGGGRNSVTLSARTI